MLTTLPADICSAVDGIIKTLANPSVELKSFTPLGGGCINNGGKLETSVGSFFIKWNDIENFSGMFEAEAKGLHLLSTTGTIVAPNVVGNSFTDLHQFLLLEFVESNSTSANFWNVLGRQLAALHKIENECYGLSHDNYIGSLPQRNDWRNSWIDFFIELRLLPQLSRAINSGRIDASASKKFEILFKKLPVLLPNEEPSLLHGDLWSGNVIADQHGAPCVIDPAVYFGHREVELAFTKLFGGFDAGFYESYEEVFPVTSGFESRVDLYNLYPLLVHVNLFGGSYSRQVMMILNSFM